MKLFMIMVVRKYSALLNQYLKNVNKNMAIYNSLLSEYAVP
jgi:hypothetical protein